MESVPHSQEIQQKISSFEKEMANVTGKPFVSQPEIQATVLSPRYLQYWD